MVSSLTSVPPRQRRRLALMLTPLALVLLVAGLLPAIGAPGLAWKLVGVLVCALALALAGVAIGLRRTAESDDRARREAELDAAIMATAGACGGDCGTCGPQDCAVKALPRL